MEKVLNYFIGIVGYPVAAYLLFISLWPKIEVLKHVSASSYDLACGFSVILGIAAFIGYICILSSLNKEYSNFVSTLLYPVVFYFGTLLLFYLEYDFTGYKDWNLILVLVWNIICGLAFPFINMMVAVFPLLAISEIKSCDDSCSESPKRTTTRITSNTKGQRIETTTKYYSNGRSEVDKRKLY